MRSLLSLAPFVFSTELVRGEGVADAILCGKQRLSHEVSIKSQSWRLTLSSSGKNKSHFFTTLSLISKTCIRFLPNSGLKTWLKPVYHSIVKIVYCPCDLLDHKYTHNARDSTQGGHMTKKRVVQGLTFKTRPTAKNFVKMSFVCTITKTHFYIKGPYLTSF